MQSNIKYASAWGCSSVGRALAWHARGRRFESDQLHQKLSYRAPCAHSMADIAQLVRALVCGTKCRRFESGYPPRQRCAALHSLCRWKYACVCICLKSSDI